MAEHVWPCYRCGAPGGVMTLTLSMTESSVRVTLCLRCAKAAVAFIGEKKGPPPSSMVTSPAARTTGLAGSAPGGVAYHREGASCGGVFSDFSGANEKKGSR